MRLKDTNPKAMNDEEVSPSKGTLRAEPSAEAYYRVKAPIVHWRVANFQVLEENIWAYLKYKIKTLFGMKSQRPVVLKYHSDPAKTPGAPTHVPLGPPGFPNHGQWIKGKKKHAFYLREQGDDIEFGNEQHYKEQEKQRTEKLLPDYETAKKQAASMKSDPEAERAIAQGWVERVTHNKAMDGRIFQMKKEPGSPTN